MYFVTPGAGSESPKSTTTTTAPAAVDCGGSGHFYAADPGISDTHKFGPSAPETVPEAIAELTHRTCSPEHRGDPALTEVLAEYIRCDLVSPDERVARTVALIEHPDKWQFAAKFLIDTISAGNPRIEDGSTRYKTMYMLTEGRLIPEIYATQVDKPHHKVLVFDTPCGTKRLKLNCGFQPEDLFPPTVPAQPAPPSPRQPSTPPRPPRIPPTTPTTPTTPSTAPPSTAPPTTVWKCAGGKVIDGIWYCDPDPQGPTTPAYQPPATVPATPGHNPPPSSPGTTVAPGATPPVVVIPSPPISVVVADPPFVGDPCAVDNPPDGC